MCSRKLNFLDIYFYMNYAIAGYILYILLLPFISPVMQKLLPDLWQCAFLRITGQPCPLCGFTRDLTSFFKGDSAALINPASIFIIFFVILNFIYRASVIAFFKKIPNRIQKIAAYTDIFIHAALLILLVISAVRRI